MIVGRLLSYWEVDFSGAMLNFGGVLFSPLPVEIIQFLTNIFQLG